MANRYLQQFGYWFVKAPVHLVGTINIAADASVSGYSIKGVASVTKTGTGEYTITLQDAYYSFLTAQCTLMAATAVDLVPQIKSVNVAAASKTVVVRLNTGATPTDPAAVCTLCVSIVCKNTSV